MWCALGVTAQEQTATAENLCYERRVVPKGTAGRGGGGSSVELRSAPHPRRYGPVAQMDRALAR
jgi:hypothetical protein